MSDSDKIDSKAPEASTSAPALILLRNEFYRDHYRRMMTLCLLLLITVVGLGGFSFYLYSTRPTPKYFATTADGTLIQMIPLDKPNLATNTLLQWAVKAATSAYTFNFVNYRSEIQSISQYFTNAGYQSFLKALKESNNLDAVRSKKLVVSAVPTGAPIILQNGIIRSANTYGWEVQLPMLVSYQSANDLLRQDIVVTLLIVRMSTLESVDGIGIERFIVEEGRAKMGATG